MNKGRFLPFPELFWAPSNTIPEIMRNPSEGRGKHAHNHTQHHRFAVTWKIHWQSKYHHIVGKISSGLSTFGLTFNFDFVSFFFSSPACDGFIIVISHCDWTSCKNQNQNQNIFGSVCCRHSFHSLGAFNPSILCEKFNNGKHCKLMLMAMG